MKLKRDHGHTQQKRLKHERAMNKLYTGNLQGKNTTTNFITNVIYYITKKLQMNFILKVSSPQRESPREDTQMILKSSQKLDVSMVSARLLSLRAQGTLVMYKIFSFHLQCFIILSTKPVRYQYNILIIACI